MEKKEIYHPTPEECEATIRRITGKRRQANLNPRGEAICGLPTVQVVMKRRYIGEGYSPVGAPSVEFNGIPARTHEEMERLKKLVLNGIPIEEEEKEEVEDLASFLENNTPAY